MTHERKPPRRAMLLFVTTLWGTPGQGVSTAVATDQTNPHRDASAQPRGTWIVTPGEAGPDLPPAGRSLFDYLVTDRDAGKPEYRIPFPFTALRDRLAAQLDHDEHGVAPIRQVLIPLGRSLQRTAAAPDVFHYPRLVLAVDGEPALRPGDAGMYLKDRLYLGYLEKSGVIEVISYNETAGRFEFQIVSNYHAGTEPELVYANRAVCTACHQNATPIFSRPLWGETNANVQVSERLARERREFYGVPVKVGIDVPNALDDATDRANRIPLVQYLWRQGCGHEPNSQATRYCRGLALRFALQYRLTGNLQFARDDNADWRMFRETFEAFFLERWPAGLLVPDPDIPNRIPLAPENLPAVTADTPASTTGDRLHRQLHVPSHLEPLRPRPPSERWQAAGSAQRFITYLAGFFARIDIQRLDRQLFDQTADTATARQHYQSRCNTRHAPRSDGSIRISLQCQPGDAAESPHFSLEGRVYMRDGSLQRGSLDKLILDDGTHLIDLDVSAAMLEQGDADSRLTLQLSRASLRARDAAGNAIESLRIDWPQGVDSQKGSAWTTSGPALVTLRHDFAALTDAISSFALQTGNDQDALSPLPLRRTTTLNAVFTELGMEPLRACCEDSSGLPVATLGNTGSSAVTPGAGSGPAADNREAGFYRRCGRCHQGSERFPPGFLRGSGAEVRDQLSRCAERLYVRLHMWALPAGQRTKTPMPPLPALEQLGVSAEAWPESDELAGMQGYVHELLEAQTGQQPRLQQLIERGYENLRECMPGVDQ